MFHFEILTSYNPKIQLKDTESATKELITELRGFKFVITLVLVVKKAENDNKTKYDTFYSN